MRNGKPAKIHDKSMTKKFSEKAEPDAIDADKAEASTGAAHLGDNAFDDLTDTQNDEFVYVY